MDNKKSNKKFIFILWLQPSTTPGLGFKNKEKALYNK